MFPCGKRKEPPSKCFLDGGHSKQEKISNLFFFFHFMIYTNFLILSSLYTTYIRNENRLWQLIPSSAFHPTKLPYILFVYFLPTFQCYVLGTSYIYVIRSDTIKRNSCESWNSTFRVCGEGENRFLNVRLDFCSLGHCMVDGGWELC